MRVHRWRLLLLAAATLAACLPRVDPAAPVRTALVASPGSGPVRTLVVVLPGRADSLRDLQRSGVAAAAQQAWPHADAMFTGLGMGYYLNAWTPLLDEALTLAARKDDARP